jgi:hypothetical protein
VETEAVIHKGNQRRRLGGAVSLRHRGAPRLLRRNRISRGAKPSLGDRGGACRGLGPRQGWVGKRSGDLAVAMRQSPKQKPDQSDNQSSTDPNPNPLKSHSIISYLRVDD